MCLSCKVFCWLTATLAASWSIATVCYIASQTHVWTLFSWSCYVIMPLLLLVHSLKIQHAECLNRLFGKALCHVLQSVCFKFGPGFTLVLMSAAKWKQNLQSEDLKQDIFRRFAWKKHNWTTFHFIVTESSLEWLMSCSPGCVTLQLSPNKPIDRNNQCERRCENMDSQEGNMKFCSFIILNRTVHISAVLPAVQSEQVALNKTMSSFSPVSLSGSSGGSGSRENSGSSGIGIPIAVPTPSIPNSGPGELC